MAKKKSGKKTKFEDVLANAMKGMPEGEGAPTGKSAPKVPPKLKKRRKGFQFPPK